MDSANHLPSEPPLPISRTLPCARERLLLDFGWRFHLGHASDAARDFGYDGDFSKTGSFVVAQQLAYDDGDWRSIDLPHDWAVELPFKNDPELKSRGFYPLGRKYPETSIGWYRRVIELPADDTGKHISIEFDGVYREALVVLNGFYLGKHTGGYDPFSYDISDFIYPGQRNVLLVRVNATERDGWFYEGAGIYRHVWLVKTNPVHVKQWGTSVRSEVRERDATLFVSSEVRNRGTAQISARVISTILDPKGNSVARDMSAAAIIADGADNNYQQRIEVRQPELWSLEARNLYKLITEIQVGGEVVDRYETPFGIRTAVFDADRGLLLNGKPVKLKGTCNHQDHAGLGVALPDAAQTFRVRKLQEMGCNALRTSHNPPTPELLDACDQLGMLVMDETRMMSSSPEGLSQLENLIRRDRNHPCVLLWSMGNEEDQATTSVGMRVLTAMKAVARRYDVSRPVTVASVGAIGKGGLAVCDVTGYNYTDPEAEEYHNAQLGKAIVGTENVSAVGTRGIYVTDPKKGSVASYDPYTTTGRASAEGWWSFCNSRPWLSGGFVWTGFDYRGEPSPNEWPNINSQYGIIDTCGFPKDSFYYYQSWWTSKPVLHLFPHWNWPGMEGKKIAVIVYSNLDSVELFLNGESIGAKEMRRDSHLEWIVGYAPGVIEARGWKNGKQTMTVRRETTGTPVKLTAFADRDTLAANGEDVAFCTVAVQDAQGRIVPITENEVAFRVTGPGKLIGVGNGDPTDHASDKGSSRKAFSGYCMAIVQTEKSAGEITVEASSPGLKSATIMLSAKQVALRPQVDEWKREAPKGVGITGLWRGGVPDSDVNSGSNDPIGNTCALYIFTQKESVLSGIVEDEGELVEAYDGVPMSISEGRVDGTKIFFKLGVDKFEGNVDGDRIELRRSVGQLFSAASPPLPPAKGERPAIGPAPDGSDPSLGAPADSLSSIPVILRRAPR